MPMYDFSGISWYFVRCSKLKKAQAAIELAL